jgi:3-phosphoshikimate 1-carboxyvinyltransferase
MSFAIAGVVCGTTIEDTECIDTSFPNFFEILSEITDIKI